MTGKKLTILNSDHFTFRILSGLEASVFFKVLPDSTNSKPRAP